MSRKDFELVAEGFLKGIHDIEQRKAAVEAFVSIAYRLNSRFNKARFIEACGLQG